MASPPQWWPTPGARLRRGLWSRTDGPLSFGASKYLTQLLRSSSNFHTLVLDLSEVPLLGVTAALAIEAICFDCRDQKREVYIVTATDQPRERLHRLKVQTIPEVTLTQSRLTALAAAISPRVN